MPKDEFDFEDPLELNGVAFLTEADTSTEMAECFAEEFMRMGYNHNQVLALFRNPHYVGPNMVLQNKGEQFVRDTIAETFAKWGRPESRTGVPPAQSEPPARDPAPGLEIHGRDVREDRRDACPTLSPTDDFDLTVTDPQGNPVPK
jgi:hypothetical protein